MMSSSEILKNERGCELDDVNEIVIAMSAVTGPISSAVVLAAVELNLFDLIATATDGFLSPSEITALLPSANPIATTSMLSRLLRILAHFSILKWSVRTGADGKAEVVYGPGRVSKFLSNKDPGGSFAHFSPLMYHQISHDSWSNMKDAILEGVTPFNKAYGRGLFEHMGTDTRLGEVFQKAMRNHSTLLMNKALENYKGFESLTSLVDVGGGTGETLNLIVSKYPSIKGINFDLPHVVKTAPAYPGIEYVEGDMYVSVPTGDAIFMKWTVHIASDEECLRLLKNCYKALPENGKVILCEYVVPFEPEPNNDLAKTGFIFDMIMLTFSGGKERTLEDFRALCNQSGFRALNACCRAYDAWILEFVK